MLIYLIILFYLFLIISQIYYSIKYKEGYKCLEEYDKPYNQLCITKEDSDTQVCLHDRLRDLCKLNTRLETYVKNNAPAPP